MGRISKMRLGWGGGTSRRRWSASRLKVHPPVGDERCSLLVGVEGAHDIVGSAKAGSSASTSIMVTSVAKGTSGGSRLPQLLLDQVSGHPLRLGTRDIQRVGLDLLVGSRLQRQQTDLRALPWESTSWWRSATGTSDFAAVRTLVRCTSTVIGSPRLSSALPPRGPRGLARPTLSFRAWRRGALTVCRRFSAWSSTMLACDSKTTPGDFEAAAHARVLHDLTPDSAVRIVERRQAMPELHLGVPRLLQERGVDLVGVSRATRSFHTSLALPIDTHTSVCTKSTPATAWPTSSVTAS